MGARGTRLQRQIQLSPQDIQILLPKRKHGHWSELAQIMRSKTSHVTFTIINVVSCGVTIRIDAPVHCSTHVYWVTYMCGVWLFAAQWVVVQWLIMYMQNICRPNIRVSGGNSGRAGNTGRLQNCCAKTKEASVIILYALTEAFTMAILRAFGVTPTSGVTPLTLLKWLLLLSGVGHFKLWLQSFFNSNQCLSLNYHRIANYSAAALFNSCVTAVL